MLRYGDLLADPVAEKAKSFGQGYTPIQTVQKQSHTRKNLKKKKCLFPMQNEIYLHEIKQNSFCNKTKNPQSLNVVEKSLHWLN